MVHHHIIMTINEAVLSALFCSWQEAEVEENYQKLIIILED